MVGEEVRGFKCSSLLSGEVPESLHFDNNSTSSGLFVWLLMMVSWMSTSWPTESLGKGLEWRLLDLGDFDFLVDFLTLCETIWPGLGSLLLGLVPV